MIRFVSRGTWLWGASFRPPLTPPNLGGEFVTTAGFKSRGTNAGTDSRVSVSPPKLGGVRGGLNKGLFLHIL